MNTAMSTKSTHPWDWNLAWQQARTKRHDRSDNSRWNKRAPSFAQNARKAIMPRSFCTCSPRSRSGVCLMSAVAPAPGHPLSSLVQQVTAIDFSETMIALLNVQCAEQGLGNIRTSLTGWG